MPATSTVAASAVSAYARHALDRVTRNATTVILSDPFCVAWPQPLAGSGSRSPPTRPPPHPATTATVSCPAAHLPTSPAAETARCYLPRSAQRPETWSPAPSRSAFPRAARARLELGCERRRNVFACEIFRKRPRLTAASEGLYLARPARKVSKNAANWPRFV